MIALYKVTARVESYVLSDTADAAGERIEAAFVSWSREGKALLAAIEDVAPVVEDCPESFAKLEPLSVRHISLPHERDFWTCSQWAAVVAADAEKEAARARAEAERLEAAVARLRARSEELDAIVRTRSQTPDAPRAEVDVGATIPDGLAAQEGE